MAQPGTCDPRAEVVAASRRRSGSIKIENDEENQPPLVPGAPSSDPQFFNVRGKFEESGGGGGKTSVLFGSSVSKIKERFQASSQGTDESTSSKWMKVSTEAPTVAPALDPRRRSSASSTLDSSNLPLQRSVMSPPMSPTQGTESHTFFGSGEVRQKKVPDKLVGVKPLDVNVDHPVSPTEPALLEVTSHVQRFNYTRALFARMEEQTRLAQEKDKVSRRRLSPGRNASASSSPMLSPTVSSPVQEFKKFPSVKDQPGPLRTLPATQATTSFSANVPNVLPSNLLGTSTRGRTSRSSESAAVSMEDEDDKKRRRSKSADSLDGSYPSSYHSADDTDEPACQEEVLRQKRQYQTRAPMIRDDSVGDRRGKYFTNSEHSKTNGLDKSAVTATVIDARDTVDASATEEIAESLSSASSLLSSSPPQYIPHSSRLEHSSRPSGRYRGLGSRTGSSPATSTVHSQFLVTAQDPDSTSSVSASDSGVVHRLRKQISSDTEPSDPALKAAAAEEQSKKRLSREEIDAALVRADSYLANLGSPNDSKEEDIVRERQSRRSQTHAESAAARRRFLYGDEANSSLLASPSPSADQVEGKKPDVFSHSTGHSVSTKSIESKVIPSPPPTESLPDKSLPSTPSSETQNKSNVQAESRSPEPVTSPHLPPPPYHEATEPPPYHEATSSSSILFSQKIEQQQRQQEKQMQQQQPPSSPVAGKPVPVPRRAAPPPPVPPNKPAPVAVSATDSIPAPAPELGSVESELVNSVASRKAVLLDHNYVDDLIMPEEHMKEHEEGVDNDVAKSEFLITRESGDGREDSGDAELSSDGEPLEIDYNNLSFIEIPPISSEEEDDDIDDSWDEVDYHKPSRVSFSRSPIKVFATFSTNDYDRRNEDVDPVAASAEYELEKRVEKMDVFPVELEKGSEGLGLTIIGMGVGADAGLEKLGIFIKTLTPRGAALKSNKIQVNDQIIEVDGKSLVGVTQAYAASVLRNTSGHVRFMIGREKDPSKSEVARLIQQSLEQDRRREEMREREQQRLKQLEDSFESKDDRPGNQKNAIPNGTDTSKFKDDKEKEEEEESQVMSEAERHQLEQDTAAGDTTPECAPWNGEEDSSPDLEQVMAEDPGAALEEGPGDLSDSASSDTEKEQLYVKFKEAQYKLAVAEAEIAKLKAKNLVLDSVEGQKKSLEKKVEELNRKFLERDKHFEAMKAELSQYKDMMVASQSQHIQLEKKVKELGALEKKYHKAKKLIKDYQQREKDFIQERESLFEQQAEKDQQYNSLVKSLKDRIFTLEKNLTSAQKETVSSSQTIPVVSDPEFTPTSSSSTPLVKATLNGLDEQLSPLNQSTEDILDASISSEISDAPNSPEVEEISEKELFVLNSPPPLDHEVVVQTSSPALASSPVSSRPRDDEVESKSDFDAINSSPLLDSSAYKDRANLASAGSIAHRRPPTKKIGMLDSPSKDQDTGSIQSAQSCQSVQSEVTENGSVGSSQAEHTESGLDMWNRHDSDSTVRKSELKKRKQAQQQQQQSPRLPHSPLPQTPKTSPPSTPSTSTTTTTATNCSLSSHPKATTTTPVRPPIAPKPQKLLNPEPASKSEDASDTSSSVSQTSYDPNRPNPKGHSEIPDFPTDDASTTSEGGSVSLVSAKPSPSAKASGSVNSDVTGSMMVTEPDDLGTGKFTLNISGTPATEENPAPNKRSQNQFQSGPITEWNTEHVCHWLMALEMDKYTASFVDKNITGLSLLQLDSSKLKTMGVVSSKDRELLKKKIKEMKANVEREKKLQEKERKQKEKEQKKLLSKKK